MALWLCIITMIIVCVGGKGKLTYSRAFQSNLQLVEDVCHLHDTAGLENTSKLTLALQKMCGFIQDTNLHNAFSVDSLARVEESTIEAVQTIYPHWFSTLLASKLDICTGLVQYCHFSENESINTTNRARCLKQYLNELLRSPSLFQKVMQGIFIWISLILTLLFLMTGTEGTTFFSKYFFLMCWQCKFLSSWCFGPVDRRRYQL